MKRKFFSVLLALVLVLSFSLVTAVPVAAATIDLAVNDENPWTDEAFTFENILPGGDPMEFDFKLHNVGDTPGVLTFSMSVSENDMAGAPAPNMSADEFASLVYVEAVHYQYIWLTDPEGPYTGSVRDDLPSWLAMDFNEDDKVSLYEICLAGIIPYDSEGDPLDAGAEITYFIEFQLGDSLDPFVAGGAILTGVEDNSSQGDGVSVTIIATLGTDIEESSGNVFQAAGTAGPVRNDTTDVTYDTIQLAIDAASAGDTISVTAGIYAENLIIPATLTNLELVGAEDAVIKGTDTVPIEGLRINASGVKVHGFTIETTDADVGDATIYGVMIENEDVEIYDNAFVATSAGTGGAIMLGTDTLGLNEVSGLSIHGNTFTADTEATVGSEGIYINHNPNHTNPASTTASSLIVTIADNEFSGNIFRAITTERDKTTITGNTIISAYALDGTMPAQAFRGIDVSSPGTNLNSDQDAVVVIGNTVTDFDWGISLGDGAGNNVFTGVSVTDNTLVGSGVGIRVRAGAAGISVNFNNITDSDTFGVENTDVSAVETLDAENNWWGNASGANYTSAAYEIAYGDIVSANVDYQPWLLAVVTEVTPTTYDKTLALKDGFTLVSSDKDVITGTTWVGTNDLSPEDPETVITVMGYGYTLEGGVLVFGGASATDLEPVSALYVKTDGGGGVGIDYSTSAPGVSEKMLLTGWNLISSATTHPANAILSPLAVVAIGEDMGPGLATFASQGNYNQFSESFFWPTLSETAWTTTLDFPLCPFDGYWAYMNAAKSFGVIPD